MQYVKESVVNACETSQAIFSLTLLQNSRTVIFLISFLVLVIQWTDH